MASDASSVATEPSRRRGRFQVAILLRPPFGLFLPHLGNGISALSIPIQRSLHSPWLGRRKKKFRSTAWRQGQVATKRCCRCATGSLQNCTFKGEKSPLGAGCRSPANSSYERGHVLSKAMRGGLAASFPSSRRGWTARLLLALLCCAAAAAAATRVEAIPEGDTHPLHPVKKAAKSLQRCVCGRPSSPCQAAIGLAGSRCQQAPHPPHHPCDPPTAGGSGRCW